MRGGNSQLILDLIGPMPLSILGTEEAGAAFSFSLRSCIAGGFIVLGFSLESGTSSFLFAVVFPGTVVVFAFVGAAGGPDLLIPEGPGFGALMGCCSFLVSCRFFLMLPGFENTSPGDSSPDGPGFGVFVELSESEYLTFVNSSSEGSTSPSSFE